MLALGSSRKSHEAHALSLVCTIRSANTRCVAPASAGDTTQLTVPTGQVYIEEIATRTKGGRTEGELRGGMDGGVSFLRLLSFAGQKSGIVEVGIRRHFCIFAARRNSKHG
ncbi:MAG: hypothetical protein IKJ18_05115 [Bacteroidaceae bacterium]|nr:hypothetical protein [Bacteroidaceae bacterium]